MRKHIAILPYPKRPNFSAFTPTLCVVGNAKAKSSRCRTSGNLRRCDIADIRPDLVHAAPTASRKTVAYARVSSDDQKKIWSGKSKYLKAIAQRKDGLSSLLPTLALA
jgi:hypothetical protein